MAISADLNRIELRKIEFRDKIADAALRLFEKHGVADTSVVSIAAEADVARKTFFNHFPSKDHLLQYLINSFSDHAYEVFRETFKRSPDPKQRIEFCFSRIAQSLAPLNPNFKELVNCYLITGESSTNLRESQKQQFSAVVHDILQDANAQGRLRSGYSVDGLTEIVVGLCVATLLSWSLEADYPLVEKMNQTIQFANKSVFID